MITFIVPTIGRPTLARAIASIELWPGDDLIVIGCSQAPKAAGQRRDVYTPRGHDYGSTERNEAMQLAYGGYLAFLDDDDVYTRGHRAIMSAAISGTPDRPILFRMEYPDGRRLWRDPVIALGNVGTPMILVPNVARRLAAWGSQVGGDFEFISGLDWPPQAFVWRSDVICHVGDNVPAHARPEYL